MPRILYLQNSLFGADGESSQLARAFIDDYRKIRPGTELVVRDLIADGVPHLDLERAAVLRGFSDDLNDEQKAVLVQSDALVDELRHSDLVVIGMPMYNFGAPTQFKAWIDHVARAGITFKYTDAGPVGLLKDKPVRVFATHGGVHAGKPYETTSVFLKQIFGFMGIQDVGFIYAEGLNMGEEVKRQALSRARAEAAAELEALNGVAV